MRCSWKPLRTSLACSLTTPPISWLSLTYLSTAESMNTSKSSIASGRGCSILGLGVGTVGTGEELAEGWREGSAAVSGCPGVSVAVAISSRREVAASRLLLALDHQSTPA